MDFSNNAFQTRPSSKLSEDNISHTKLVQSCRFGWSVGPSDSQSAIAAPVSAPVSTHTTTSTYIDKRAKRLTPCRGRLYHQLTCAHRIRTDLIEDCGTNCLEPYTTTNNSLSPVPFYCQECVDRDSNQFWETRSAEHDAQYPSIGQMTPDQYNQWYEEHQILQAQYGIDRKKYEMQQRAASRPSNVCSALEMSKEEEAFAKELDGLSLSLMASSSSSSPSLSVATLLSLSTPASSLGEDSVAAVSRESRRPSHPHYHPYSRQRTTLPTDASEQLHWGLNSLNIDRGSCGVEYSGGSPVQSPSRPQQIVAKEDVWRPRGPATRK
ncbi:unnamed protein product [Periconia digitata]|uniref:Uncharacterized protein n=1 Tax=Periconia digitata TaxID=1303443 RepID=A0A9W4UKF0_9PLEO|nr:unnamed protein product [Periconia digitata]